MTEASSPEVRSVGAVDESSRDVAVGATAPSSVSLRRVAIASGVGTAIEWYDYF